MRHAAAEWKCWPGGARRRSSSGGGTFESSKRRRLRSFFLSKGTAGAPRAHAETTFDPRAAPRYRDSFAGAAVVLAPKTTTSDASAAATRNPKLGRGDVVAERYIGVTVVVVLRARARLPLSTAFARRAPYRRMRKKAEWRGGTRIFR
ncbi:hypothetical protein MTO96_001566 [Rhipicephalus appendiculatus]